MDFLDRINKAIDYIEDNLTGDIDPDRLARVAGSSTFHFQRMFSVITNVPLAEYIRRRRLTLAAFDLQNTDLKILEIALKYGYDSHESFTRAFIKLHGVPPSYARVKGMQLKAYPKIKFHISIEGDEEMNYRIETKPRFTMFGVQAVISMCNGENFKQIPAMWQESMENGTVDRLVELSKGAPHPGGKGLLPVNAVMCYKDTGKDTFPYLIGAFAPEQGIPEGYETVEVPELLWAIFTTEKYRPNDATNPIQDTWKRIYSEWFPSSGYEPAEGPELEMYYTEAGDEEFCEIWIPVKAK